MIINGNNTDIDPRIAQFSQSAQPGLLSKYLVSEAPRRDTPSDPWTGDNSPAVDVSPNPNSGTGSKSSNIGTGKALANAGMNIAGVEPGVALGVNTVYDVATRNPNAAKNAFTGAGLWGAREVTKNALGNLAPLASPVIAMGAEAFKDDPNYGKAATSAIGSTLGGMIGSLLGPLGAVGGAMLGGGAMGQSYSDGGLGDALNSRQGESFRDAMENAGKSYKESAAAERELSVMDEKGDRSRSGSEDMASRERDRAINSAMALGGGGYRNGGPSPASSGLFDGGYKNGGPSPTSSGLFDIGEILERAGWATPQTPLGKAIDASFGAGKGNDNEGNGPGESMAGGPDAGFGADGSAYA